MNRRPVSQGSELATQDAEMRIELLDRLGHVSGNHPITPFDCFVFQSRAGQINRAPLTAASACRGGILRVNHASAQAEARAQNPYRIPDCKMPSDCRSGDD